MQLSPALLGLPTSLLLLVATQLEAQQLPTAIRKMSLDDGEKILPDYLAFAPQFSPAQSPLEARGQPTPEEELLLFANSSATLPYRPPFGVHHGYSIADGPGSELTLFRRARDALSRLQRRQWSCPANTHSCDNISQPNYCCSVGETCFTVQNAPEAGNVGCCPQNANCGGSVGQCGAGSTSCPASLGGACCIAGFVCAGPIGCVASGGGGGGGGTTTTTSTTVVPPPTTTTTTTSTTRPSPSTTTTSAPPATTTTSGEAMPPFRPTSSSSGASAPTASSDFCPTGFYACLARAGSGCCRTGRDCVTTSCPPVASTTITTNGATVVVPVSDVPTTRPTSTCAGGWFLCPSEAGPVAGCCPSGYACGTASCTLSTSTATATVQKLFPTANAGARVRGPRGGVAGALGFVLGAALVLM